MRLHKLFSVLIALCILTMFAAPAFAVIYVNATASGANDGTSWADAYTDLKEALNFAWDGEIWVVAGTYKPTTTEDRAISFSMPNGVKIYGGFAGTETARDQRNWETNKTILSGDIGIEGNNTDNSYHVIKNVSPMDETSVLDGFTITGGNANDNSYWENIIGGGMINADGSPTINNCIFSDNSALDAGGGMFNANRDPTINNCTFSGNSATNSGGGMFNTNSSPRINNCTFSGNSAGYSGGGIFNDSYTGPAIINCIFSNNSTTSTSSSRNSGRPGGAEYIITQLATYLIYCLF